ncbi:MAG: hypothetical protein ACLT76_09380 [Clostridium fessum]
MVRTALIEAVRNAFEGVLSIIKPVKEAFREVFPPMTGEQLYNLTVGLQELTEKFKMGEETANNLEENIQGVFALFDIGLQGVKALVGGFADLIDLCGSGRRWYSWVYGQHWRFHCRY